MIKFIKRRWLWRQERFYKKNRWHLVLDITMAMVIIILIAVTITLYFYHPFISNTKTVIKSVPEKIELDLNNPPLTFDFSVATSSFDLSDGVQLKININNSSKISASDIKISLSPLDKNFSVASKKELMIGSLAAGESKELTTKIYFKNNNSAVRTIKWQAEKQYSVSGQIVKEVVSLPDLYVNAELTAQAEIYYNSPQGDELGSGPLPPLVGLPTNYWAFFEVKSAGEFKNFVFSAKLPKGVELTDKRSLLAGDFSYNPSSRQIIWKISELKNQNDSYRVGFEIQFIPSDKQVDKTAVLLDGLKCYAHDSLTGNDSQVKLPSLTTNLDFDKINKGAGKIGRP